ncbi:hypothetical protein [Sphingomonas sp. RT2P30]
MPLFERSEATLKPVPTPCTFVPGGASRAMIEWLRLPPPLLLAR